jgi:hypothetical protein
MVHLRCHLRPAQILEIQDLLVCAVVPLRGMLRISWLPCSLDAKHILRRYNIADVAIRTGSEMMIVFQESVSRRIARMMHNGKTRRTRKRFASGLSFDDMVWVLEGVRGAGARRKGERSRCLKEGKI